MSAIRSLSGGKRTQGKHREIGTRAALVAKKKTGQPARSRQCRCYGATNPNAAADEFVAGLLPLVRASQNTGATTLDAITRALNERGVRPARGTRWYVSSPLWQAVAGRRPRAGGSPVPHRSRFQAKRAAVVRGLCRARECSVLVSKLDRLSRDVAYLEHRLLDIANSKSLD
jgi:hypothetical protein